MTSYTKLFNRTLMLLWMLRVLVPEHSACAGRWTPLRSYDSLEQQLKLLAERLLIPGFSACILYHDSICWKTSYGFSDLEHHRATTTQTVYSLASLSKPIASAVALKLENQGLFDLDAPVATSLQHILNQYRIPIDESIGEITARHLLSHTSGNPPGVWYQYDGDRYSLLTTIFEQASAMSYPELVRQTILVPAVMAHTCPITQLARYPETRELLAVPYTYDSLGQLIRGSYTNQSNTATGWVSNTEDLARFISGLWDDRFIPGSSMNQAFKPFQMKTGGASGYGLGWFIETTGGQELIWHNGFGYCTSGLILLVPKMEVAFIILANSDRMSRPFPLGLPGISVLESPFALAFYRWMMNTEIKPADKKILQNADLRGRWNMAQIVGDTLMQQSLMELYRKENPTRSPFDLPWENRIACIKHVRGKGHFREAFSLSADTVIHIEAIGDGGYSKAMRMYDKIYITDSLTGNVVWEMTPVHSTPAGGHPRNRKANLLLPLDSGQYILHVDNSHSPYTHYPGHWEAFPPPGESWGAAVFLPMDEFDCLQARIEDNEAYGRYEENRWLFEKGHHEGYFFLLHPSLPSCQPYTSYDWFDPVSAMDLSLRDSANRTATTTYILHYPKGYDPHKIYPLLMVLHGGGSNAEKAQEHWKSPLLENHFIVAFLESYRHYTSQTYGWKPGDSRDRSEFNRCLKEIIQTNPIDTSFLILAGISAGASMAADLFVNEIVPANGLIAISPLMPAVDSSLSIQPAGISGRRAILAIGLEDTTQRIEQTDSLSIWFNHHDIPCSVFKLQGLGHAYPDHFSDWLDNWLSRDGLQQPVRTERPGR